MSLVELAAATAELNELAAFVRLCDRIRLSLKWAQLLLVIVVLDNDDNDDELRFKAVLDDDERFDDFESEFKKAALMK